MDNNMDDNTVNELLVTDGDSSISYWVPESLHKGKNFFFTVADDGGYSSVLMNKDAWEQMKKKVDELFEKDEKWNMNQKKQ